MNRRNPDKEDWQAWSGRVGVTYNMDAGLVYGNFSRSQRAGGYNLRNTAADTVNLGPGPSEHLRVLHGHLRPAA